MNHKFLLLKRGRHSLSKLVLTKKTQNCFRQTYCSSSVLFSGKNDKNTSSSSPTYVFDHNIILKLSGSNPDETTIDGPSHQKSKSPFIKLDPKAIFPWRHSPHPLPRLLPDNAEFNYLGSPLPPLNKFFRTLAWMSATGLLINGSILNYFTWKDDLEEGFKLAFAVAVERMLIDVYNVKNEKKPILKSNDSICINKENNSCSSDSNESESYQEDPTPSINFNDDIIPIPQDELTSDINHDKYITSQTRDMLEAHLISLYKSAHERAKHKLNVLLQSTPISATIISFFPILFLTRDEVIKKPALKHSFRDIGKRIQQEIMKKGSALNMFEFGDVIATELDEMAAVQMKRKGDKMTQCTVIAQVAIECEEVFRVVDVDTGDVIQGDPKAQTQEVTHLVRFEIVVDVNVETGDMEIGSWQITDWDDLLVGNTSWFW